MFLLNTLSPKVMDVGRRLGAVALLLLQIGGRISEADGWELK